MNLHRLVVRPGACALAVAVVGMGAASDARGTALLLYQMGQAQPQTENSLTGADGGDLTNGGGYTTFNLTATDTYPSAPVLHVNPNAASADATAAYSANQFIRFTLTVGSNVADLDLTNLTFNVAKGGSGTRGYGVRASTPTSTNQQLAPSTVLSNTRPNFVTPDISLADAAFQNLTAGQVVTFDIAGFTNGTGSSLEFDDIQVNGNVTLTPEPASLALVTLGAAVTTLRRRRGR